MKNKLFVSTAFILWLGIILGAFFVVQKPAVIGVAGGLASMLGTILFALLFLCVGTGFGYFVLSRSNLDLIFSQRLMFSAGIGMGLLGLLGFGLAVIDFAQGWFLLTLLMVILGVLIWKRTLSPAWQDLLALRAELIESSKSAPAWIAWFALAELFFACLLSLAPPAEAFDGLFYHLTVPSLWLRDGGIQLFNMPHYWYPSLLEGMFLWPLSFGLDSTPQLIHLTFGILSVLLVWDWTRLLFGRRAAWWSIVIFLSMPSLPWLASWAYTDLGLIFYSLAALLALSKWKESSNERWLLVGGAMAGFAVGIKYTSFILPLVMLGLMVWWLRRDIRRLAVSILKFGSMGLLVGFPWYLRNWVWTGNPVYPFVFGGPYWDAFRSAWYGGAGTGIGWNFLEIFSLPFVTTLGYRDVNYFDGRIGPFYLILFPAIFWVVWRTWKEQNGRKKDVTILLSFSLASIIFWVLGVIQTDHLMQARLLWPGLFPLIPFMAAGILGLESLDTPKFRLSFMFSALAGLTTFFLLLDFGLLVMFRNPVMAAVGSESRQAYIARIQPKYAQALELANETPPDAFIYLLNEPRSYGMNRRVQPDPVNDNLPHDFHLYAANTELLNAWRMQGYTHVLAAKSFLAPDNVQVYALAPNYSARLDELISSLIEIERSSKGDYILFAIPPE